MPDILTTVYGSVELRSCSVTLVRVTGTTEEENVAKGRPGRVDPHWPEGPDGGHPVTELTSDVQGALSPFGTVTFPLPVEDLGYTHPVTEINKS
ncbi:hypothetical protein GCM10022267_42370 [Lentzea roselyniae]|uniref:Uncharacterized protein n=1 Tax=Lentzea roselyniae TaxID=531940 RepID=A0ABP7B791_9PSEU